MKVTSEIFRVWVKKFEFISVLYVTAKGPKTNFETFCNSMNNTCFLFNIICLMETWYNNFQINNNLNTVFETAPKEKMKSVIIGKFNLISLNDDKDSNTNFSYKVIWTRICSFYLEVYTTLQKQLDNKLVTF